MEKKDIYEHLAEIYLDASSKRKKKTKAYPEVFKTLFFISAFFILGLSAALLVSFQRHKPFASEVSLLLYPDVLKLNFNFDSAKKEIYSLNLDKLDLARFRAIGFSARKNNYQDNISLRVEFNSVFKERSEVYFKDIPHKWQDYKINLSEFKNISDWSKILNLAFIVEEWNVKKKSGIVYIDNVRLLR